MSESEWWRVAHSAAVFGQLRACSEAARRAGRLRQFVACSEWMLSELERTPLEFGESRGELAGPPLLLRCGGVGALFVRYAVHLQTRTVFLQRFFWRT